MAYLSDSSSNSAGLALKIWLSSGVLSLGISVLSSSTKLSFLFGLRILMALEGIVI